MKITTLLFLLVAVVVMAFAGVAAAMVMSGTVTAVNVQKGTISLKAETMAASFDCETGSLLEGVKVGDTVTLQYTEAGGRKLVTGITRIAPMRKEESPAPYNPPAY